jgi:hypothetical protein
VCAGRRPPTCGVEAIFEVPKEGPGGARSELHHWPVWWKRGGLLLGLPSPESAAPLCLCHSHQVGVDRFPPRSGIDGAPARSIECTVLQVYVGWSKPSTRLIDRLMGLASGLTRRPMEEEGRLAIDRERSAGPVPTPMPRDRSGGDVCVGGGATRSLTRSCVIAAHCQAAGKGANCLTLRACQITGPFRSSSFPSIITNPQAAGLSSPPPIPQRPTHTHTHQSQPHPTKTTARSSEEAARALHGTGVALKGGVWFRADPRRREGEGATG